MDNDVLKILNEELIELKTTYGVGRAPSGSGAGGIESAFGNIEKTIRHAGSAPSGFEILFRNMKDMEERMRIELKKLWDSR